MTQSCASPLSALGMIAYRPRPCIMSQKCCTNHKMQLGVRTAQHSTGRNVDSSADVFGDV